MAIEIVKRGKLPEEKVLHGTCIHCKTEIRCKASDAKPSPDPRDRSECFVSCPVCYRLIWL